MLQNIRKFVRGYQLKKSEKKWVLYDDVVKSQINWEFSFIDQFKTGGHFNSQITTGNLKPVCNSVIVINLNKRVTGETLLHVLTHEGIHVAICECIANSNSEFIETVVDDWIMGQTLNCNGLEGNLYIKKGRGQKYGKDQRD